MIDVRIPMTDGSDHIVKAAEINPRWCAYRADKRSGWSLTHRGTGFSSGKGLKSVASAARLARKLERAYGVKRWTFNNPNAVKGMVLCPQIIRKHGARP